MIFTLLACVGTDTGAGFADSAEPTIEQHDSGADSGDTAADSGDTGADSGDTASDTGDSGDTASDTGDTASDTGDTASDTGDTADVDTGDGVSPTAPADWALPDLNPNSARYGETISPRDYIARVSGYYFIHST